jgi:hypothetical protein
MYPAEIQSLMNSPVSAAHPDLVAGYTFDSYPANSLVHSTLKRPIPLALALFT